MTAVLRIKDENGNWVDVPAIVGPQGPRGPVGPQGPKGEDAPEEGEWELIEKIIIGYELLLEKPSDWETNWTAYFRNTGTAIEPVYTQIADASAPTWEEGIYYVYSGDGAALRRYYPDDESYRFKKG